jgi:uncharacterized protein YbcI
MNMRDGAADVAATGDTSMLGVALDPTDGRAPDSITIRIITDRDAVYGVDDPHARRAGEAVALTGGSGAQGVGDGTGDDLWIDADSPVGEETLVRIADGRHRPIDGTGAAEHLSGGELNAAITRAVVRLHREHTGRGPTRAQAFYRGNVVVVVMYDAMTRAESSLVAGGRPDMVLRVRTAFQETMRGELIMIIESLTGCGVEAFMSCNHIDPDMASEVFVLDRPVPGEAAERR